MKIKLRKPFSGFKPDNWRNLLYFVIICFYSILFSLLIVKGARGSDYEAYWITGKIADTKGFSELYNPSEVKFVYRQLIDKYPDKAKNYDLLNFSSPAPYFSLFFLPFKFLSRISVASGFAIWTFINLVILIGYLLFFLRRIDFGNCTYATNMKLLIPFLIAYPVFFNIMCGQVEVFVLICTGEFIRQAINKKPILSGFWLGGLLLKPQLLILIIPIFIIMHYWKALTGFFVSFVLILAISLKLSGLAGILALTKLWTSYGNGVPASAIQIMINWRMIGSDLNELFNTSLGWVITSLGIILTILAVSFLIKQIPSYGSSLWTIKMIGIFAATLAISWHAHFHMAMVLIPFLVYALVNKLLPEKWIQLWAIATPVAYLGTITIELFFFGFTRMEPFNIHELVIAFTGIVSNLLILLIIIQYNKSLEGSPLKQLSINDSI